MNLNYKKEKYLRGNIINDMDNLTKAFGECIRHYIRCLKPNAKKRKIIFRCLVFPFVN